MKIKILFPAVLFLLLTACGNRPQESTDSYDEEFEEREDFMAEDPSQEENEGLFSKVLNETGKKRHEFRDARTGIVVSSVEYPASWKVISLPTYTMDQKIPSFLIQIQGPNNLKYFNTPLKVHISYQNPQTYQLMSQSSMAGMTRPIVSNRQIVQEEVSGRMQSSGFSYVRDIQLPKSENFLRQKLAQNGGNFQMDLLSSVWENGQGQKAVTTVSKISMQMPFINDVSTLWLYNVQYMFVDASKFDQCISQMEEALLSTKDNPEWKQYTNQLNQQRMQASAIRHQQNMANRQAAFDAHQEKMKGIWAAQDANHAAFMNRNFGSGSSTSHQQFINTINEQETVYNPLTGSNYQVDAGSTEYWMDSDGNYIKNDDLFYTPNGDINLNNRDWVKVESAY